MEKNEKLQARNRQLQAEIKEHKRAEQALRQSEMHFHRLLNESREMQESLRELTNEILRTREEERQRISRELHDEVGQSLAAISLALTTLSNHAMSNSSAGGQNLSHTQSLLQETMKAVQGFARDLRPAMLDELGLVPALRSYCNRFATRTGLRIQYQANPIAEQLHTDAKLVAFRIAQERLTNLSKHAQVSRVTVTLRKFKAGIRMEVADDGKSSKADPRASDNGEGRLGLLGMQERARLVNGQFTIRSQFGKGTIVRVTIPFKLPAHCDAAATTAEPRPWKSVHNGKNSPRLIRNN